MFGALIEFAVVNYVSRRDSDTKKNKKKRLNAYASMAARMALQDDGEFGLKNDQQTRSQRHRYRNSNRTSARKKFESGKDSGIESDDLEEVIATRYVKTLGAVKLGNQQYKNSLSTEAQENLPLTSGHRDSLGNYSNLPASQYANSPTATHSKQKQLSMHSNQLNNRTSFSSTQPIYRNTQQQFNNDEQQNDNGQTNFVNLVVNSEAKTNAIGVKRSKNFFVNWLNRFPNRAKRIDVLSRIFFPILFALFNVFYWITYLFRDELQK